MVYQFKIVLLFCIPNGGGMSVLSHLSCLFAQTKYIPLRYCPLILEFEVVNDFNEPIVRPVVPASNSIVATVG